MKEHKNDREALRASLAHCLAGMSRFEVQRLAQEMGLDQARSLRLPSEWVVRWIIDRPQQLQEALGQSKFVEEVLDLEEP